MKHIYKISCCFLVLLLSNFAAAQTKLTHDILLNPVNRLQILSSKTLSPYNQKNSAAISSNVYVQQIGNNNNVVSETRSSNAAVNLLQFGNSNHINLSLSSLNIDENVIQTGNNHNFIDINSKASLLHSTNVIQQGSNQNLIKIGANSMSDRLIVNMRGTDQTVLIRNIKR